MFKNLWKSFLNRKITILMVPFTQARVRQVKFPIFVLLIIFTFTVSLFSASIYTITRYLNYYRVFEQNKALRKKIDVFASESVKLSKAAKKVYGLEMSLQNLLGMKSKKKIIESSGMGGPSYLDEKELSKELAGENGEEKFRKISGDIYNDINERASSFMNVEDFINEQRSIYAATPRGNPLSGGWITSGFGKRSGVVLDHGGSEFHRGMDIANDIGSPIKATAFGVVAYSGKKGGYGNVVIISHGYGYTTVYAHNRKNLVSTGDKVKRGQTIAYLGQTGNVTGPHVHYEIRRNNIPINPENSLDE